jgi:hypothetical protein
LNPWHENVLRSAPWARQDEQPWYTTVHHIEDEDAA